MAEEVTSLIIKVEAKGADAATRDLNKLERQGDKTSRSTQALSRGMKALGAIAATAITLQTVTAVARLADQYTLLQSRLKAATDATGDYNQVSRQLFELSQDTGTALRDNIELFDRIRIGAQELGRTNEEVIELVEAINKLGQIGGSSSTELSNAAIQLSQGLAGGIIRAEEFNSIIENTPRLAQAIAEGLGRSVGELRGMVLEGELLADDVFESILRQTDKIERDFNKLETTIARSTTSFGNSFEKFIGRLNEATGATGEIAAIIEQIARGLDVATESMFGASDPIERLTDSMNDLFNERLQLVAIMRHEADASSELSQFTQERIDEIDQEMKALDMKRQKLIEVRIEESKQGKEGGGTATSISAELKQEVIDVRASLDKRFALNQEYRDNLREIDELYAKDAISLAEKTELEKLAAQERARASSRLALSEATITEENDPMLQRIEATRRGEEIMTEIVRDGEQARLRVRQSLNQQVLNTAATAANSLASLIEESQGKQSAAYQAAFLAQQGLAIAQAIMNTELAATTALAPPPLGLGPVAGAPYAATIRALGYTSVGVIAAQTVGELAAINGRALGGQARPGETYLVGERGPELLTMGNQGGNVTPNSRLKQGASESGKPSTVINIIEDRSRAGRTETTTGGDGREQVSVFVNDIGIGGPMSKALQTTFGLKRQGR